MTVQTVESALGHMMGEKKRRIRATWVISPTNVPWSLVHLGTVGVYSFISSISPTRGTSQKAVEGTEAVITADRRCTSRVQIRAEGGKTERIQVKLSSLKHGIIRP